MIIRHSRGIFRQQRSLYDGLTSCCVRSITTSPILPPERPSPSPPHPASQPLASIEPLQGIQITSPLLVECTDCIEPKFEVIGNVCSLLNVTIPAAWPLYTRRGTLVSMRGQIENVVRSKPACSQ